MAKPKKRKHAADQQDQDAKTCKDRSDLCLFLIDLKARLNTFVDRTQVFLRLGIEIKTIGDLGNLLQGRFIHLCVDREPVDS